MFLAAAAASVDFGKSSGTGFVLRSPVSGTTTTCLDVPGDQATVGPQLQLWYCNGNTARAWQNPDPVIERTPSDPMEGPVHMSDTATGGDRLVATDSKDNEDVLAVAVNPPDVAVPNGVAPSAIIGRSPGQLAWLRLRRDRSVVFTVAALIVFFVLGAGAPIWSWLYGQDPLDNHPDLISLHGGLPSGINGGMSGTHWLGVEPLLGRDILMQLIYGLRTSLLVSIIAAVLTTALGVLIGIVAGYATGWLAALINWFTDFILAFPFLIFSLAAIPVIVNRFYGNSPTQPWWFRITILILVLAMFGWPFTARIIRGQVLSLREREFVEGARAAGAGVGHMLFRELLPNLWAPILVVFSLAVPSFITAEAALSFLQIGILEPTPDLGRMIAYSVTYIQADPWYMIFPGVTILLLVLAFNLLGDSVRDALDPKSSR